MSTRGWKQSRRRRTFPVTRILFTNRVTFCTVKRRFFGKFDPVVETFLECETTCREMPPEQVFVQSLAEIDPRKVVEVVRRTRHKKQRAATHFSRSLRNPSRDFAVNVQGLVFSGLNLTCQVSSKSIQVSQIY